jgi:uncharacterized protein YjbI with pentapeptide repeats
MMLLPAWQIAGLSVVYVFAGWVQHKWLMFKGQMKTTFANILITIGILCSTSCSGQTGSFAEQACREVQATDILARLDEGKHVYLDSCVVWGDLDFTALRNRNRIAANLTQVFVGQSVTFNGCVFTGKVKAFDATAGVCVEFAHNLSFTACDFRSEADFTEIVVGGNAFFTGSVFRGKANLQGAHFRHRKAYFNEMRFEGEALFQNAVFTGDANFMHTVFAASAMFQKTRSGGLMFFGNARFYGYADFTYARAVESIFRYAEFKDRYDFGYSQLNAEGLPEEIIKQELSKNN